MVRARRAVASIEQPASAALVPPLEVQSGVIDLDRQVDVEAKLSPRAVDILNYAQSHYGFAARSHLWINQPILLGYTPEEVRWIHTNERIVEIPFVFSAIGSLRPQARIIDIGCCESLVAVSLASCGYRVTSIDIRPYRFTHPNLTVVVGDIVELEGFGDSYDAAILLSTLEHVGIPVYGVATFEEKKDLLVMEKVRRLLRPGGLLVLTVPFGVSDLGETERTYSWVDLQGLLTGFEVEKCELAVRADETTWITTDLGKFDALCEMEKADETGKVVMLVARCL